MTPESPDLHARANAIMIDVLMNHLPRVKEGFEKGYPDENQILVMYDHAVRARLLMELAALQPCTAAPTPQGPIGAHGRAGRMCCQGMPKPDDRDVTGAKLCARCHGLGEVMANGHGDEECPYCGGTGKQFKMPNELNKIVYDLVDAIADLDVRYSFIDRLAKIEDGYYSGFGTAGGHKGFRGVAGIR